MSCFRVLFKALFLSLLALPRGIRKIKFEILIQVFQKPFWHDHIFKLSTQVWSAKSHVWGKIRFQKRKSASDCKHAKGLNQWLSCSIFYHHPLVTRWWLLYVCCCCMYRRQIGFCISEHEIFTEHQSYISSSSLNPNPSKAHVWPNKYRFKSACKRLL